MKVNSLCDTLLMYLTKLWFELQVNKCNICFVPSVVKSKTSYGVKFPLHTKLNFFSSELMVHSSMGFISGRFAETPVGKLSGEKTLLRHRLKLPVSLAVFVL